MNELANVTNASAPAIPQGFNFGFESVSTKDIKIPIIYIAQNMSDAVSDGNAKPGDIIENLSQKVLGSKDKPAQIIPFYFQKTYQVQKLLNGKKEFHANEPFDFERPYEEQRDGTTYYNYPCYNFFVLVNNDETYTRYVLTFRGSRNINSAGKPMLTALMQAYRTKKAPYELVFEVGVKQVENDKGKWFVFTSAQTNLSTNNTAKEYAHSYALDMENMIKQGAVVDTSSVAETTQTGDAPF